MTDKTTGRRIRIETGPNPDGKHRVGLSPMHGGRILVDDQDISDHVTAVDIHIDGKSIPTARLETIGLELEVEAMEARAEPATAGAVESAAPQFACVGCTAEHHAGQREHINPATLIVGGNSICRDHLQIQQGPIIPGRTPGGIILGNGS